ncbi:MAG TPA: hypothetical protein VM370_02490 [Candidatus Thermoplasmatota archaeon]|nr:hypothetical protein [Candidatus Thermoplasmatota archaeon]
MSLTVVARRIADVLARAPDETPRLTALEPAAAPARALAVDGSSVVLAEAGDHLLAAYRAGAVGVERGRPLAPRVPNAEVVFLAKLHARDAVAAKLEEDGFPAAGVPRLSTGEALDALRTIEEMRAALAVLEGLDAGDLLLLDGALQARGHIPMLERVLARALERGVDVVGVCKSTSMTIGAAPAIVACQLAGRSFPSKTWWAPLPPRASVRGASFAARLSPAEERVFRFDIASSDATVLASLAGLCGHPAYPGYPSPLAMAHNAVLLNDDARRRLLAQVQEAAIAAGADARAWEAAFVDYHDILELGA